MATTAIRTHTITADTNPTEITGKPVAFTIAGGSGAPLALNGTWVTLRHMDFGNGVVGMGGTFNGVHGHTSMFMPYGTVIAFN